MKPWDSRQSLTERELVGYTFQASGNFQGTFWGRRSGCCLLHDQGSPGGPDGGASCPSSPQLSQETLWCSPAWAQPPHFSLGEALVPTKATLEMRRKRLPNHILQVDKSHLDSILQITVSGKMGFLCDCIYISSAFLFILLPYSLAAI